MGFLAFIFCVGYLGIYVLGYCAELKALEDHANAKLEAKQKG